MKNLLSAVGLLLYLLVISSAAKQSHAQAPNYQWAKSEGGTSYDFGTGISTDANGNVLVTGYFKSPSITFGTTTLTNADNSGNTADIFVVKLGSVTGIAEEFGNEDSGFTISPNPLSSSTTLHTNNLLKNATLTVYNCFGQAVKEIKNINGQTVVLARDNLASGLYFIRLIEENKIIAVDKLVITD